MFPSPGACSLTGFHAGDVTSLLGFPRGFVFVPRRRGPQLKEPVQLDGWLRDGSAVLVDSLGAWGRSFPPWQMGYTGNFFQSCPICDPRLSHGWHLRRDLPSLGIGRSELLTGNRKLPRQVFRWQARRQRISIGSQSPADAADCAGAENQEAPPKESSSDVSIEQAGNRGRSQCQAIGVCRLREGADLRRPLLPPPE
jgi:hypothetical protein